MVSSHQLTNDIGLHVNTSITVSMIRVLGGISFFCNECGQLETSEGHTLPFCRFQFVRIEIQFC